MKRGCLPWLVAALLVAALSLLFFWKLVFTNLILVGVDSFLYFYPYKAYVAQDLLAGRLPLWNPHLFMGGPLLANMQTAILYPLHWPLLWLPAPKQVAASIVLHVTLGGWGVLAYARRSLKLSWPSALTAAVVFALGGFIGGQAEHVNQLNAIAWLPWAFLLFDIAAQSRRRAVPVLALALVLALMILAGHAQATFIGIVALMAYALAGGWPAPAAPLRALGTTRTCGPHLPALPAARRPGRWGRCGAGVPRGPGEPGAVSRAIRPYLASRLPHLAVLAVALVMAVLLASVQLLPTLELSRLSVRSGGLPYREAVSFSLRPWRLHYTLLPPFGVNLEQVFGEAYGEYVAYVGVVGLGLAALGLLRGWRRHRQARFSALLAAGGLFLGLGAFNPFYFLLYKLVPGFDLFRAPARWMLLYALGAALLAGMGMEQISDKRPALSDQPPATSDPTIQASKHAIFQLSNLQSLISNLLRPLVLTLLCVELFLASRGLAYNQPTAPEAFTFLRPSIAHLKTDPGLHRFLSLSGIVYDPGDLAEIRAIFAEQLPEKAIYDYVVAAKQKEVLAYNLPLLYGLYSVDGYDGGLLPLRDFVGMQRLFLDEEHLSLDGRLRENLREVPPGRLLSLLGVKYVITDKVFDVWIEDVFYDLQFSARLSPSGVSSVGSRELPDFPSTALGVISHLEGASDIPDGTPVARLSLTDETGWSRTFELLAGRDTSEGRYSAATTHRMARVGHAWHDDPAGKDYIALITLDAPRRLSSLSVEGMAPAGQFVLRGISLIDTRTTASRQLTLSTEGHYRLVHSGDVKIYENLDVLPRAFVVHRAEVVSADEQAIARLRDPALDPAQLAILAGGQPLAGEGSATAEIVRYTPEEVVVDVTGDAPGYLLLTDAFYPGWQATVDGRPADILRADLMFRAVRLEPGAHRVTFGYRPASLRWGARVSGATFLLWLAGLVWSLRKFLVRGSQL